MESLDLVKADQLDYSSHAVLEPSYKYMPVSLNNQPSGVISLAPNTTSMNEFKLPSSRVVNFGRSYVNFGIYAPKCVVSAVNYAIGTFEDVSPFASAVSLATSNGTEVARLDNLQQHQKLVRKIDTPLETFMTNDKLGNLYRSNKSAITNFIPAGGAATEEFIEPLYMNSTVMSDGDAGIGELNQQRQFKLSTLTGTILGVDRNFYCPADMYLRFVTVKGDNIAWGQKLADVAPGADVDIVSVPGLTMNNVTLWLCVETNQDIIKMTQAACLAGGLTYDIPYTMSNRQTGQAASGQTNLQIAYNSSHGHRLKRIITTAFNPVETLNKSLDCDNTNGIRTAAYNTLLDNVKLQDRVLSCLLPAGQAVNSDDWAENRRYIDKGKSTYLSKEMYGINWFHMDSFCEIKGVGDIPEVNLDRGLDMAIPKQWQFSSQVGSTGGLAHYTFAEFTRPILVTPLGVEFTPYPLIVSNLRISS